MVRISSSSSGSGSEAPREDALGRVPVWTGADVDCELAATSATGSVAAVELVTTSAAGLGSGAVAELAAGAGAAGAAVLNLLTTAVYWFISMTAASRRT